jgi:hypothetical protein
VCERTTVCVRGRKSNKVQSSTKLLLGLPVRAHHLNSSTAHNAQPPSIARTHNISTKGTTCPEHHLNITQRSASTHIAATHNISSIAHHLPASQPRTTHHLHERHNVDRRSAQDLSVSQRRFVCRSSLSKSSVSITFLANSKTPKFLAPS